MLGLMSLCWVASAWAQDGAPAMTAGLPPDLQVWTEVARLAGAPGLALALGWGLARWRPQVTVVVRHELPEGSTLQVLTREHSVDEEERTGSWVRSPRKRPPPTDDGGTGAH